MAIFVTLDQAKIHLRVDGDSQNADVYLKAQQASDIVVDYLKVRRIAIASIAVGNPAVITTSVPHSLISGMTYPITGTTTTPTVNGSQVVTVVTPTTFTVPVNVTVGQASAAGTVGAPSWDATTVPLPVQAATLLILTGLYERRGDDMDPDGALWQAVGRLLVRFRDPAVA